MTNSAMHERVDGLRAGRTPFVLATVVRAERPTSAKPGDSALVLPDGTIEGFVGGVCAESTVRLEGLRLLHAGESTLLRITPSGDDNPEPVEGLRTVGNPCLSGGTLEIFLEAVIPPVLVQVFGEAPVARAMVRVGAALDYDVRSGTDPAVTIASDAGAVVVASHGRDEEAVLLAALRAEVPYLALVASRRRAAAVLASLDVPDADRQRIRAPAGLDIGARTPPEIALSVFADMIERRPRSQSPSAAPMADLLAEVEPLGAAAGGDAPVPSAAAPGAADHVTAPVAAPVLEATDPVCGMSVAVSPASISAHHGAATWYFCGPGCRQAFLGDPTRYRH